MFWDKRPEDIELGVEMTGPDIREGEVEKAIRMKGGKAIEMLRALNNFSSKKITSQLYVQFNILTIPKKPRTLECNKYRTKSIMSQVSKLILRIVLERISNKIKREIVE